MQKQTKGKQATRGEKQILEENKSTVNYYFLVLVISNVSYLVLRYLLFWQSFTTYYIVLYVITALVASLAYYFVSYMGRPIVDENGTIIGAGSDLNLPGFNHKSEYHKFWVYIV